MKTDRSIFCHRRRRALRVDELAIIRRAFAAGLSRRIAARLVGCRVEALDNIRLRGPEFQQRLDQEEADGAGTACCGLQLYTGP